MKYPVYIHFGKNMKPYPLHPSVVYCENGYAGHKFWMAETPVPPFRMKPYRDRWELPCIHYSDNGLEWFSLQNDPIDDISQEQISKGHFFSDTHLILVNGVMECYYRLYETNGVRTAIYRKKSTDMVHWSEREFVVENDDNLPNSKVGHALVSPSFVYKDGEYQMWYVNDEPINDKRGVSTSILRDGEWQKFQVCTFDKPVYPWHIDIQYFDGLYHLITYSFENEIAYYTSKDGVNFDFVQDIIQSSKRKIDFYPRLYRACAVKKEKDILVYFSAIKGYNTSIGLLIRKEDGQIIVVNGRPKMQQKIAYWKMVIKGFITHIICFIKRRLLKTL